MTAVKNRDDPGQLLVLLAYGILASITVPSSVNREYCGIYKRSIIRCQK